MSKTGRRGRPPKFREARSPVTVTLPVTTLAQLASIDADRARAIVKVTEAAIQAEGTQKYRVDIVEITPGVGIIVVGPSQLLRRVDGLRLVEVAPFRYILSIPSGTSIESLELAMIDLLEDGKACEEWERSMLNGLRDLIRRLRHQRALSKAEMLFIDTRAFEADKVADFLAS